MDPWTTVLKEIDYLSVYLSDEQNLKGVRFLGSLTISPLTKGVNSSYHKPMRKFALRA